MTETTRQYVERVVAERWAGETRVPVGAITSLAENAGVTKQRIQHILLGMGLRGQKTGAKITTMPLTRNIPASTLLVCESKEPYDPSPTPPVNPSEVHGS